MRAEIERQRRIKEKTLAAFGKPPPNFRQLEADAEVKAGVAIAPGARRRSSSSAKEPPPQEMPANAVPASVKLTGLAWKDAMILKKYKEQQAEEHARRNEADKERSRWEGMPEWKKTLLQSRERKNWWVHVATNLRARRCRCRLAGLPLRCCPCGRRC